MITKSIYVSLISFTILILTSCKSGSEKANNSAKNDTVFVEDPDNPGSFIQKTN
jgi:hypothetical protein